MKGAEGIEYYAARRGLINGSAWKATGGASVEESDGVRAGNRSESDAHPSWVVPFWMLLALAAMFALGCVFGWFLTWLSMLGPFGPGHGPEVD